MQHESVQANGTDRRVIDRFQRDAMFHARVVTTLRLLAYEGHRIDDEIVATILDAYDRTKAPADPLFGDHELHRALMSMPVGIAPALDLLDGSSASRVQPI
jgi:hypothetical protein